MEKCKVCNDSKSDVYDGVCYECFYKNEEYEWELNEIRNGR